MISTLIYTVHYCMENLITRYCRIKSTVRLRVHEERFDIFTYVYKRVLMANMCIHAGSQQYDLHASSNLKGWRTDLWRQIKQNLLTPYFFHNRPILHPHNRVHASILTNVHRNSIVSKRPHWLFLNYITNMKISCVLCIMK